MCAIGLVWFDTKTSEYAVSTESKAHVKSESSCRWWTGWTRAPYPARTSATATLACTSWCRRPCTAPMWRASSRETSSRTLPAMWNWTPTWLRLFWTSGKLCAPCVPLLRPHTPLMQPLVPAALSMCIACPALVPAGHMGHVSTASCVHCFHVCPSQLYHWLH